MLRTIVCAVFCAVFCLAGTCQAYYPLDALRDALAVALENETSLKYTSSFAMKARLSLTGYAFILQVLAGTTAWWECSSLKGFQTRQPL